MNADHMIDWKKTAAEIQDDYAAVCRKRDELLAALEGLHKVCEIALSGKDGKQHAYFETRSGHFVEATKAMQEAEAAIRDELSKFAKPVAYMTTSDDGDPAMLFFDAGEALKYSGEDSPMNLFAFPPSAAARIAELEKQRDGLLAAVEKFIDSHEECTDFDGFPAQIASMDDYHEFQGAIAKAKEVAS